MFKSAKSHLLGIVFLSIGTLFVNCQDGGSELPNELRGQVVMKGGTPAARLKVGLYSVNYIPTDSASDGLSWTTHTDASGQYAFKDIPPGRYNLLGIQDSLGFFRDSISISGEISVGRDSLDRLGSVVGMVRLQPQHDPRNAMVQVLGTDNYVNVDADGRFTLSGLADGAYRLRVFVELPQYVPLFKDFRVQKGKQDTLVVPLAPYFSGLPVVTGIKATLDTVRGIAKITWNRVDYPALLTYLVYRDPANAVELGGMPLNSSRILDTVFFDTLYQYDASGRVLGDDLRQDWEYRVRVKANNSAIGEAFEAATLDAVSPKIFETSLRIERLGDSTRSVFLGDTIRFVIHYSNPSYNHRNLVWLSETMDTLRKAEVSNLSGTDTLTWIAPNQPDTTVIQVKVIDVTGKPWSQSVQIFTAASRIIGTIQNPSSEVNAYAWNGKMVHVTQNVRGKLIIGLFNVSTKKDSILDSTASFMPPIGALYYTIYSTAFSGSKLHFFHATHPNFIGANCISYDVATGLWAQNTNVPGEVLRGGAVASSGSLYAILRKDTGWASVNDTARVYAFNPSTQVWTQKKSRLFSQSVQLSEYEGLIYLVNGNEFMNSVLESYDPTTDTWSPIPNMTQLIPRARFKWVGVNGKLYTIGGESVGMRHWNEVDAYDLSQRTWSAAPNLLLARGFPGVVALGSSLYVISGQANMTPTSQMPKFEITATVEEYRPE